MPLEIPDGAEHPVRWSINYLRHTGMKINHMQENNMVRAWESYLKATLAEKATEGSAESAPNFTKPPIDGSASSGFTTGSGGSGGSKSSGKHHEPSAEDWFEEDEEDEDDFR